MMTNIMRHMLVILTTIVIMSTIQSCGNTHRTAYSHFEQIGKDGWDPADVISYEPALADSTISKSQQFDMSLILRYSSRQMTPAIPLAITIEDEKGIVGSDTIIADSKSARFVKSRTRYGVREEIYSLGKNVQISDGYSVSVSPLSERSHSKGLINVGLILEME